MGEVRYRAVNRVNVQNTPHWGRLSAEVREAITVVSLVLPFRTNRYVMDHLIDWDRFDEMTVVGPVVNGLYGVSLLDGSAIAV